MKDRDWGLLPMAKWWSATRTKFSMRMKLSFLFILISVAVVFSVQARGERRVSLLVTYCDKDESGCDVRHIDKFDFVDGNLFSRKRVVTLNQDIEGFANRVIQNRYLLTAPVGKIFDLQAGKFVGVLPVRGKRTEKSELPGLISPDGKKSILNSKFGSTDRLEIHFAKKPLLMVVGDFQVTVRQSSSIYPSLPLLWIDNERVLTQKSNGNLVIISTGGTVSPFIRLPCAPEDSISLKRNRSAKIVYQCEGEDYFIDVENRRFEKIKRDLGNGFALDFAGPNEVYFYNGEEIGRDGFDAVTIKSYLAMLWGKSDNGFLDTSTVKTIKIWSETKRAWTKLTVDGWGAEIIGWIEQ